ncbi:MAG TPA: ester cyclase [Dehalococcoidia bacterium]|nr:ester cyclase [Dehalococcoidia bacterium]
MGTVEEKNKELVRRYCELWSQHELDAANEIISPSCFRKDFTWEQNKQLDNMIFKAFPDVKMIIVDMIAEGDKVAAIRNITGTHTGEPYMGIPPTGKKLDITGTNIGRIVDNKIVENRGTSNQMGWWQQLGVLPSTEEIIKAYKDSHI